MTASHDCPLYIERCVKSRRDLKLPQVDVYNYIYIIYYGGKSKLAATYYSGVCVTLLRLNMYFYGASKKILHKPRANFANELFQINYGFHYYVQLFCLQFLSKTHLNF
jgi:hypothetical protein